MAVLLIAEVTGGTLGADSTAKALTAAKPLGEVHLLIAGEGVAAAAAEAAQFAGVSKVLRAASPTGEPTVKLPAATGARPQEELAAPGVPKFPPLP